MLKRLKLIGITLTCLAAVGVLSIGVYELHSSVVYAILGITAFVMLAIIAYLVSVRISREGDKGTQRRSSPSKSPAPDRAKGNQGGSGLLKRLAIFAIGTVLVVSFIHWLLPGGVDTITSFASETPTVASGHPQAPSSRAYIIAQPRSLSDSKAEAMEEARHNREEIEARNVPFTSSYQELPKWERIPTGGYDWNVHVENDAPHINQCASLGLAPLQDEVGDHPCSPGEYHGWVRVLPLTVDQDPIKGRIYYTFR